MGKLKIISTSDLYSKEKKKGQQKILVTQDLKDEAIHRGFDVDNRPSTVVTTSDGKEKAKNED